MKKRRSIALLALLGAHLSIACSDSGDNDHDDDNNGEGDTCSDEDFIPPTQEGEAGGAPAAECVAPQPPKDEIEIAGEYTDNFDEKHKITGESWGTVNLSLVNNEENYALGRNDESTEWNPCSWVRLVWHEEDGKLYYCTAPYAAQSECAAEEDELPDPEDLVSGCGGFNWSELTTN